MIFISLNDFFEKASKCRRLNRQDEIECARQMKNGDVSARERLIESYLPMVAAHVKRISPHLQSFGMVIYCQQALEKAVQSSNFEQNGETFAHRLSWYLRQATTRYIAEVRG